MTIRKAFILIFFYNFMADNQIRLPSGMGGLVRYNEDSSKVEVKPEYLVALIAVVIIIEILLHTF